MFGAYGEYDLKFERLHEEVQDLKTQLKYQNDLIKYLIQQLGIKPYDEFVQDEKYRKINEPLFKEG
jgi:hypothetical protein